MPFHIMRFHSRTHLILIIVVVLQLVKCNIPTARLNLTCPTDYVTGTMLNCDCQITGNGSPDPGIAVWYSKSGVNISRGNPAKLNVTSDLVNTNGTGLFRCRAESSQGSGEFIDYEAKLAFGPNTIFLKPLQSLILTKTQIPFTCEIPKGDDAPHSKTTVESIVYDSGGTISFNTTCHESAGGQDILTPNHRYECTGWAPEVPDHYRIECTAKNGMYPQVYSVTDTRTALIIDPPVVELTNCTNNANCTCQLSDPGKPPGEVRWVNGSGNIVVSGDLQAVLDFDAHGHNKNYTCQAVSLWTVRQEIHFTSIVKVLAVPVQVNWMDNLWGSDNIAPIIEGGVPSLASLGVLDTPPMDENSSLPRANVSVYCDVTYTNPSIKVELIGFDQSGVSVLNATEPDVIFSKANNESRYVFRFSPPLNDQKRPNLNMTIKCKAENAYNPNVTTEDVLTLANPTLELYNCPPNSGGSTHDVDLFKREANCTCQLSSPGIPPGEVRWVNGSGSIVVSGGLQAVLGMDIHDHNQTYICQALTLWTVVEEIKFTPNFRVLPNAEIANCSVYETLARLSGRWITAGGPEDPFHCGCRLEDRGIPENGTKAQWVDRGTGTVIIEDHQEAVLNYTRVEGEESKTFICRAENVIGVSENNTALNIHYAYGPSHASIGVLDTPPMDRKSSLTPANVSVYCDVTIANPSINVQLTGLDQSGGLVVNVTKPDDIISMANVSRFVFRFPPPLDDQQRPNLNMTIKCKAENAIDPNINAKDEISLEIPKVEITGCPQNIGGSIHEVELSKYSTTCTCQLSIAGLPQGNVRWFDGDGNTVASGDLAVTHTFSSDDHNKTFMCQALTLWSVVQEIPFTPIFSDLPSASIAKCPIYEARTKGEKIWVVAGGPDDPFECHCTLFNLGFPREGSMARWIDGDTGQLIRENPFYVYVGYTRGPGVSSKKFKCEGENTIGKSLTSPSFQVNYIHGPTEVSIGLLETPKNDSIKDSQNPSKLSIFCDIPTDVTPSVNVSVIGTNGRGEKIITVDKPDENMTMAIISRWTFSFQAPVNKEGKPQLDLTVTCKAENSVKSSIFVEDKITLQMPSVELSGCPPKIEGTTHHGVGKSKHNVRCTCRLMKPGFPKGEVRWVNANNMTLASGHTEAVLEVDVKDHLMPFTCQALTLNSVVETIPFQPKLTDPPGSEFDVELLIIIVSCLVLLFLIILVSIYLYWRAKDKDSSDQRHTHSRMITKVSPMN